MFSCRRGSLTDEGCIFPTASDLSAFTKLPPIMSGAGRGRKPTFDLDSPYNSQSLAAGGSALLDAINRGKVHLAKFILDAGEYDAANVRDFKGKTPLIRACYIREMSTRDKAVKLLLKKGADVNVQDDSGRTTLSYACEMRCNDIVRILVKNNVDPDIADNTGNTPLIYSVMAGNDTAVDIILRSFRRLGLNVDHVNNEGMTALLIAAKNGYIACASLLATEGKACLTFKDRENGRNAEEWARAFGCSTPEVIPFSADAQLYQNKLAKYLRFSAQQFESEGEETEESEEENGEEAASKEYVIKQRSREQTQENMPGQAMYTDKDDLTQYKHHQSMAAKKRGSLPAIKFSPENGHLKVRSETYLKKSSSSMASGLVSEAVGDSRETLPNLPPLTNTGQVKQQEGVWTHQQSKSDTESDLKSTTAAVLSPVMRLKKIQIDEEVNVKAAVAEMRVSSPCDARYSPLPPIEVGVASVPEVTLGHLTPEHCRTSVASDITLLSTSKVSFEMDSPAATQTLAQDQLPT